MNLKINHVAVVTLMNYSVRLIIKLNQSNLARKTSHNDHQLVSLQLNNSFFLKVLNYLKILHMT